MEFKQIIVRLDDETMKMWLDICATFKGTTRSKVFRNLIKKLHSSVEEATNIKHYE